MEFAKGYMKKDGTTFIEEGSDVNIILLTGEVVSGSLIKVAKKELRILTDGIKRVELVDDVQDINIA